MSRATGSQGTAVAKEVLYMNEREVYVRDYGSDVRKLLSVIAITAHQTDRMMRYFSDDTVNIEDFKFDCPPTDVELYQVLHTGLKHDPSTTEKLEKLISKFIALARPQKDPSGTRKHRASERFGISIRRCAFSTKFATNASFLSLFSFAEFEKTAGWF